MTRLPQTLGRFAHVVALAAAFAVRAAAAPAQEPPQLDYLSLAQGVIPVAIEGAATELRVGMDLALLVIDGDPGGFVMTPAPGGAEAGVSVVYALPARTTFSGFAVPNVFETPSPSQTFFRTVTVSGSDEGPQGPFEVLARATLATHSEKNQLTTMPATHKLPVRWVRVALEGGIDVQRDKTFFEFTELIGHGSQEPVPLSNAFDGKWKGRGVLLEMKQAGVRVTGCYDGEGDLTGSVTGNLLRATGKSRKSGVPSTFVLAVDGEGGIFGVRSTNGAPFRLYGGDATPGLTTECSEKAVQPLGCGAIIHGILFDYDSASIRPESESVLDALSAGLGASTASSITVVGHTSSEGSEDYNEDLSRRRAQAIVAALIERGIDKALVSAEGRGEKQPIAPNATEIGRSMNRRVEVDCR